MKPTRVFALLTALALLVTFTACTGKSEGDGTTAASTEPYVLPTPTVTADLSLAYTSAAGFDPYATDSALNRNLFGLLYEGLYAPTEDGLGTAVLASGGENKGTAVEVKLNQGVTFGDGSAFTAKAVIDSFEKAAESEFYADLLSNIEGAEALDNYTVRFTLHHPDAFAFNALSFPVVSGEGNKIAGTGPYRVQTLENAVCLQANEGYRGADAVANKQIGLYDMAGVSSPVYPFKAGKFCAWVQDLAADEYLNLSSVTVKQPTTRLVYVGLNSVWSGSLASLDWFRQALHLGLNRTEVAAASFLGQCAPVATPFPAAFTDREKASAPDLGGSAEAAVQLLESHGYTERGEDGVRSDGGSSLRVSLLVCTENPYKKGVAEAVKNSLATIGVGVEIREFENPEDFLKAVSSEQFDMYIGETLLTPAYDLSPFFDAGGALCYGIDEAQQKSYDVFRSGKESAAAFCTAFGESVPFLPLFYRSAIVSVNPNVRGAADGADVYAQAAGWTVTAKK